MPRNIPHRQGGARWFDGMEFTLAARGTKEQCRQLFPALKEQWRRVRIRRWRADTDEWAVWVNTARKPGSELKPSG